jgi:outer membrane autotransporter protein
MVMVPRAAVAWQHAFEDVTPTAQLAFVNTGVGFTVSGVPLARDAAFVEAGLDLRVNPRITLGVSYACQVASNVEDHAVKSKFTWNLRCFRSFRAVCRNPRLV